MCGRLFLRGRGGRRSLHLPVRLFRRTRAPTRLIAYLFSVIQDVEAEDVEVEAEIDPLDIEEASDAGEADSEALDTDDEEDGQDVIDTDVSDGKKDLPHLLFWPN